MKWRMRRLLLSSVFLFKECHRSGVPRQIRPSKRPTLVKYVQILRDFLYLDEYQGTHSKQKLHSCGTCGKQLYVSTNLHQHQKQCIREKPFRRDVDRASFVKNCKCHVSGKPLVFRVVGKDFLASSQFLQQWATHTWERSNSRTECGVAFQRGKTYHNWEECTKAFSPKHTLVRH